MLNQMLLIKVTNRYSLWYDDLTVHLCTLMTLVTLVPDKRCDYYQILNSMQYHLKMKAICKLKGHGGKTKGDTFK